MRRTDCLKRAVCRSSSPDEAVALLFRRVGTNRAVVFFCFPFNAVQRLLDLFGVGMFEPHHLIAGACSN